MLISPTASVPYPLQTKGPRLSRTPLTKAATSGSLLPLGRAALRAPPAVGDTVLDGPVERRPVSAGLSAGDNLQVRKQSVVHGLAYTLNTNRFPE